MFFKKKNQTDETPDEKPRRFSTDERSKRKLPAPAAIKSAGDDAMQGVAMDSACDINSTASRGAGHSIPIEQFHWYASQGFIGFHMCATIAQHWLVDKACTMPAADAARVGFMLEVEGDDKTQDIITLTEKLNKQFKVKHHAVQFERMNRVFGQRIAMFLIDSTDPEYYKKPYNPDGIKAGSYRGIVQIDPVWCSPQLGAEALNDPTHPDFYEPTYWQIGSKIIHKSHLIINRTGEVADYLKPTYRYGGVPIPQKIFERVYAAERTANEAPMLAMTKRTDILKTDVTGLFSDMAEFELNMQTFINNRDNYGVKIIANEDEMTRLDTTLSDLDVVIMTQYQIVAAAANVPATKLLGTSPKGFNASGDYEIKSYYDELESIQAHGMTPLLDRHHEILMRSEIMPQLGLSAPLEVNIVWNAADTPSEAEWADINLKKAQTGQILMATGAIDGRDERIRLMNDPDSCYTGLEPIDDSEIDDFGLEDEDDETAALND
jgi:phage-related protein (TIGR01555 family)